MVVRLNKQPLLFDQSRNHKEGEVAMKMSKWFGLVVLILLMSLSTLVSAQSAQTLDVEATSYIVSSQWLPAGDEAGHSIGMQQRAGMANFSDGSVAQYSTVSNFDFRRGKGGSSSGYSKFTFNDGATIVFSWTAKMIIGEYGLTLNEGQGIILKGTGRFAGIKGTSSFSGRQLKSAAEDPKGSAIQNATIRYTLPKQ